MKFYLAVFAIILLSGCKTGNGDNLDDQGRPLEETPVVATTTTDATPTEPTEPDPVDDSIKPTLSSIQEKIFSTTCASCHGGANPAAGQDLSSIEKTIENLINVDSANALFKRVLPGSAAESYLYLKITGDSRAGSRMPLGQPALADDAIAAIKQWIDDGALVPESAAKPAKVSRVTRVNNMNGQNTVNGTTKIANVSAKVDYVWRLNEPLVIVIWFDQAMNFTGLTKEQLLLTVSDNSQALSTHASYSSNNNDANSWTLASDKLAINIVNDHVLQLNITDLDSGVQQINIQLNKTSIATMMSHSGLQLDGDVDGREGGVFSYDIIL